MKTYNVILPLAGHVSIEVEAESEEDAINKALASEITFSDIEEWDVLRKFHSGNVCHCPSPWEAEAEAERAFGEDEDAA